MTKGEVEAFLAVIQNGGISAAADKLGITQPALSRRIAAIEEELGCVLIERGRGVRGSRLTPEGESFVVLAEWMLRIYTEAGMLASSGGRPTIRVGASSSTAYYLLADVLRAFLSDKAKYRLSLRILSDSELYGAVESGELDIAVSPLLLRNSGVRTVPVLSEPFVAVGAGMPFDADEPIEAATLDASAELRVQWNADVDAWHRRTFETALQPSASIDATPHIENFIVGNTWTLAPLTVALKMVRDDLMFNEVDDPPEDRIIYSLTPMKNPDVGKVSYFLGLFRTYLDDVGGIERFI